MPSQLRSTEVLHHDSTLYAEDGVRLFMQRWTPARGEKAADVLLIHGYADHGSRYRELGHRFAAAGLAVTAVDLRGHGRSEGPRGFVRSFDEYHRDVRAAFAAQSGAAPKLLLGHSLGGLIALDVAERDPLRQKLAGLIVMSPFLALSMPVPRYKLTLADAAARIYPRLALPSGLMPEQMSRDPAAVEAYRRDPLVFRSATAGWYFATREAQARVLAMSELEMPLLAYYGGADPVANGETTRGLVNRISAPEKTLREIPGALHELLQESHREETYDQIIAWVREHASR